MNCEEIKELLSAFLDGELGEQEAAQVREHLDRCPDCAAELAALRQVSALYRELPDPGPPADLERRVWAELRKAPQAPAAAARKRFRWPLLTGTRLSVAAGLAVFLCVVILAIKTQSQRRADRAITDAKAISESAERYAVDRSRAVEIPARATAGQPRDDLAQIALRSAPSQPETQRVINGEPAPAAAPQAASAPAPAAGAAKAELREPAARAEEMAPPSGMAGAPPTEARKEEKQIAFGAAQAGEKQKVLAEAKAPPSSKPVSELAPAQASRAPSVAATTPKPLAKGAATIAGGAVVPLRVEDRAAELKGQEAAVSSSGAAPTALIGRPIAAGESVYLAGGAMRVTVESAELKQTDSGAICLSLKWVAHGAPPTAAVAAASSATARVILHLDRGPDPVENLEVGRIRLLPPSAHAGNGEVSHTSVIPIAAVKLKGARSVSLSLAPVEKADKQANRGIGEEP